MATTKIYDGKILASAVTAALSNVLINWILDIILHTSLFSIGAGQTLIPILSNFALQSDETCSHKLMAQHSIRYPWSIGSDAASAAIWDTKWLLTNNDSEIQQRGCYEGQNLYHASVKSSQTWFTNLVQEVATNAALKAMKVANQMACLAMALQPERIYHNYLSHVTGA